MADIKFLIEVDSTGAVKSVKNFDDVLEDLKKKSDTAKPAHNALWKDVALGTLAVDVAKKSWGIAKDTIVSWAEAAMDAEKKDAAIRAALEITKRPVKELSDHFGEMASVLQKETVYNDEAIKGTQALMLQMVDLDSKGIDRATKGAIGLASVFGMDLESAGQIVTKGLLGHTEALGRYGITVDKTLPLEQQRNQLLEKLEPFYKRAQAETGTFAGKLSQLGNTYDDIKEAAGRFITQNAAVMDGLNTLAEGILYLATADEMLAKKDAVLNDQEERHCMWLGKAAVNAGWKYGEMAKLIDKYGGHTAALIRDINQEKYGTEVKKTLTDAVRGARDAYDKEEEARKKAEKGAIAAAQADKESAEAKRKLADEAQKIVDKYNPLHAHVRSLIEEQKKLTAAYKAGVITEAEYRRGMDAVQKELEGLGDTIIDTAIPAFNRMNLIAEQAAAKHQDAAYSTKKSWYDAALSWVASSQEGIQKVFDQVLNFTGQIDALSQASLNKKLAQLDKEYQARLEQIKNSKMSEEEKNQAIEALEAEYNMKREQAQQKAAGQQKLGAIAQALISTYEAAAKALTAGPIIGPILAGVITAMGLLQVAKIRSTPVAQGAIFKQPALLQSMTTGRAYEVAEAGESEIISSPSKLRKALGLEARGGGSAGVGKIALTIPIYIGTKKIQEEVIEIVEEASQTHRLRRLSTRSFATT